jgi:hypothetical protein
MLAEISKKEAPRKNRTNKRGIVSRYPHGGESPCLKGREQPVYYPEI